MNLENRRKFIRVPFDANFEVKTKTWSDPSAKGLDISLNGCRFHCEQFLSEDETVSLNLRKDIEIKGKIRWCWPIEWYFLAAVHFENISKEEQEKLKYYIEDVTGENYQMEKEEESVNEIIEGSEEDDDEIEFNDLEEIDDLSFDVVGEDENEGDINDDELGEDLEDFSQVDEEGIDNSSEVEEDFENLSPLTEEDLINSGDEANLSHSNKALEDHHNENITHKFADSDLNPLSFKGKNVIIFNMLNEQAEILNRYLTERIGMNVECVSKKQNLWRHMKIDQVDLIILESGPNSYSDALEVMQQTEDQFPGVNYFCISGPVSLERRMQFLNAGALDYITRPIHLSAIAQSILIHLSRMDFYKEESENENPTSKSIIPSADKFNINSSETFHDEDLTDDLELTDKDLDVSREIELVDKDF